MFPNHLKLALYVLSAAGANLIWLQILFTVKYAFVLLPLKNDRNVVLNRSYKFHRNKMVKKLLWDYGCKRNYLF